MNSQPLVSVLIATYNSASTLPALLESVKKQSYGSLEIVVVDNNSRDNTLEIAQRYTDKVYTQGPERSAQRNFAASKASGEFIIVLDSDMLLTEHVVRDVVATFNQQQDLLALVIPEESFGEGFWANCKKLERSFYLGVDWMEAARAFRLYVFNEMQGYDENNTGTEDYDLPHRIEQQYGKHTFGRINALIMHDEGKFDFIRSCKKKFYYAKALEVYVSKPENAAYFSRQANPLYRFGLYFRSPTKLFKHPLLGLGMLFMKICEMSAGMLGYLLRGRKSDMKSSIYK